MHSLGAKCACVRMPSSFPFCCIHTKCHRPKALEHRKMESGGSRGVMQSQKIPGPSSCVYPSHVVQMNRHKKSNSRYWSTVMNLSPASSSDGPGSHPVNEGQAQGRSRPQSWRTCSGIKKAKKFLCHICSARFERKGHLQSHIDTVHNGKRDFKCGDGCEKTFAHKSSLRRHVRKAHEPGMKVFDVM